MGNKEYKETLAKQEDLNWDGNIEQQDSTTEYTIVVDEDRMEQLRKLISPLQLDLVFFSKEKYFFQSSVGK